MRSPAESHTRLKWFSTAMVLIIMVALFLFSAQGRESEELSGVFAGAVMDANLLDFSTFARVQSGEVPVDVFVNQLVRKAAHVAIYFLLGLFLFVSLYCWLRHRKPVLPLAVLVGALYAGSDELHQYFVPNRSGELGDVLIDTIGVLLGALAAMLVIRSVRKYRANLREKGEDYMNPEPIKKQRLVYHLLIALVLAALAAACVQMALQVVHMDLINAVPRQLLLVLGLFLLLGAGVLWIHFSPSGARFYAALDRGLLNPETRKPAVDIVYAVLAGLMILHHFAVTLYYPDWAAGAQKLTPVWVPFAALSVLLGRLWRHRIFWPASLFFLFTFERLFIADPAIGGSAIVYFSSALYAMFICMAVFPVLRKSFRRPFLLVLCAVWTAGALVLSGVGLHFAWTGEAVKNLAGTVSTIRGGRLDIFYPSTICAGFLSVSAMVSLAGFAVSRRAWAKVLFLLSAFPMLLASALTGSRSSMGAAAIALGLMICLALQRPLKQRWIPKHAWLRAAVLLLCLVILTGGFLVGQVYLSDGFNAVREKGGLLLSSALAEEAAPTPAPIKHRGFLDYENINKLLSGRLATWEKCFAHIRENPVILVSGLSVNGDVRPVINQKAHTHNILLQTLMEGGVPGLLLFLAVLVCFAVHAVRLFRRAELPLWQRMLPVPVLSILVMEMTECLSHFSFGHVPMTFFWFFIGCTAAVGHSLKSPAAKGTGG